MTTTTRSTYLAERVGRLTTAQLRRALRRMGVPVEPEVDPYGPHVNVDQVIARKLARAYVEAHTVRYETPQGNIREKTQKRQDADEAVLLALADLAAGLPHHPFGPTPSLVITKVWLAVYGDEAAVSQHVADTQT